MFANNNHNNVYMQDGQYYSVYGSLNKVRGFIKSRTLKRAGYVARIEEDKRAFKFLTAKPTGKRPLGRLDGSSALEYILNKYVSLPEIGVIRLRRGIDGESL